MNPAWVGRCLDHAGLEFDLRYGCAVCFHGRVVHCYNAKHSPECRGMLRDCGPGGGR